MRSAPECVKTGHHPSKSPIQPATTICGHTPGLSIALNRNHLSNDLAAFYDCIPVIAVIALGDELAALPVPSNRNHSMHHQPPSCAVDNHIAPAHSARAVGNPDPIPIPNRRPHTLAGHGDGVLAAQLRPNIQRRFQHVGRQSAIPLPSQSANKATARSAHEKAWPGRQKAHTSPPVHPRNRSGRRVGPWPYPLLRPASHLPR